MRLKEKKLLQKFAATLKKFSAQGAKKVEYGIPKNILDVFLLFFFCFVFFCNFLFVCLWGVCFLTFFLLLFELSPERSTQYGSEPQRNTFSCVRLPFWYQTAFHIHCTIWSESESVASGITLKHVHMYIEID